MNTFQNDSRQLTKKFFVFFYRHQHIEPNFLVGLRLINIFLD